MTVIWLDHCASTQDELSQADQAVIAVATLNQSAGRGRRGRAWQSPKGAGLALSWRAAVNDLAIEDLPLLSLASGVALYRTLSQYLTQPLTQPLTRSQTRSQAALSQTDEPINELCLKWPNDLLFQHRKLAGILCEGRITNNGQAVLVGIGLNLFHHHEFPQEYAILSELGIQLESASTLKEARNIQEFCHRLIAELEQALNELKEHKAGLLAQWQRFGLSLGTHLKAAGYQGVYQGINAQGALLLDINGQVISVESGEVHLLSLASHL